LYNTTCYSTCPNGTYASGVVCTVCDSYCVTCNVSSTNCYSCVVSGANKAYLYNNTCQISCPIGTYFTSSSNICNSCDPTCIACDTSSTNCSSCTLTGGNQAYLLNSTCLTSCPNGTFSSTNPNICTSCDPTCTVCDTSSTHCSVCTVSGANMAYLYNSGCVINCPNGTYSSTNPNVCNSCDPKCIICSASSTDCSSCTLNGGNQAYLLNSTCISTCPDGTFSSTNPNICTSCDPKCLLCDTSNTNCSSCTLNGTNKAYLFNSTCISSCPGGTFPSDNPNICNSCDSKCSACDTSSTNCSACTLSGANIAYLYNMTCTVSCPTGTFSSSNPNICNSCDPKCIACDTSSTNCSSCTLTGGNQAYLLNLTCIASCAAGTYTTTNPNLCNSCAVQCSVCTGPTSS
jgi:proprotein convertase subtilisin/kexin type 5